MFNAESPGDFKRLDVAGKRGFQMQVCLLRFAGCFLKHVQKKAVWCSCLLLCCTYLELSSFRSPSTRGVLLVDETRRYRNGRYHHHHHHLYKNHHHHHYQQQQQHYSDESRFKVLLTVTGKLKRQCLVHKSQFMKRKENRSGIDPRSFCIPA